jgi:hypothetical protein
MTKKTKTYSHHFKFDVGKYSKWRCGNRSLFQLLQGDFDPNSSRDYFVFFQPNEKSDFSKYERPKMLSISKRSDTVFKLTKLYKCLSLRYTCAQCSNCNEFFSTFNTTKHYSYWESELMPTISKTVFKFNESILCTDCVFVMHIEDDENE